MVRGFLLCVWCVVTTVEGSRECDARLRGWSLVLRVCGVWCVRVEVATRVCMQVVADVVESSVLQATSRGLACCASSVERRVEWCGSCERLWLECCVATSQECGDVYVVCYNELRHVWAGSAAGILRRNHQRVGLV